MKRSARITLGLVVSMAFIASSRSHLASQTLKPAPTFDREYTLEATTLGYRGVGGEIDGVRNPTLWARTGENVRITMVNGELMVHDIVLEKLNVRSQQILDRGATTRITFKAKSSDTYFCSLPGHRAAGMEGRLEVSDEPRVPSVGTLPMSNGRTLNLDFETGTLDDWTASRKRVRARQGRHRRRDSAERKSGYAGSFWVSSAPGGSARKGTLSSAPFAVTQPYASFLMSGGAFTSTRVELVLAQRRHGDLHDLRRGSAAASPGGGRSQGFRRKRDLRPARRRGSGNVDRRLHQRASLGAHQFRQLPFS